MSAGNVVAAVPDAPSRMRACATCQVVQTLDQFIQLGCPNCPEELPSRGSEDKVFEATTQHFEGLTAILKPTRSWVARWKRLEDRVPGMYALKVHRTDAIEEEYYEEDYDEEDADFVDDAGVDED